MADKYAFLPVEQLAEPRTGMVFVDHYWPLTENEEVGFFISGGEAKPMHNPDGRIVERLLATFPWAVSFRQIPAVYVPTSPMQLKKMFLAYEQTVSR